MCLPPPPACGSRVLLSPSGLPCPTYFQGHSWGAATTLYSGNMITSGRVCYSFATRAIGVQMALEKHSISRNSSPRKGRCAHCSLETCLSRAWPLLVVQESWVQGWHRTGTFSLTIGPGAGQVPKEFLRGPLPSLISAAALGCEAQNFIGGAVVKLCMPLDLHYHRDPAGGGRSLPCHPVPAPLGLSDSSAPGRGFLAGF